MEYQLTRKGSLPACRINASFMDELWRSFCQKGEFIWNAVIEAGASHINKTAERPQVAVHDWEELVQILSSQDVEYLQITVEYADIGSLSLAFKNYDPAGGSIVVAGQEQGWVDAIFKTIEDLFIAASDRFVTKLYNRYGSFFIHSVIPLLLSFIIVSIVTAIIIPGDIRRSEFIWWITAGTVLATLKLGQVISDRLIAYMLIKYPYLRWYR